MGIQTIDQVRRQNLDALLAEAKGNQAAMARRIGKSPKQVNQWFGKGSARNISSETCREIEAAWPKPAGWMDTPHDSATVVALPSQPTGYSRESMSLAVEVARYWIDLQGLQGGVEDHIPLLYLAHQLVLEAREPATVLDLSKKLAARLREETGSNGDQRGNPEEPGGTGGEVRGRPARGRKK